MGGIISSSFSAISLACQTATCCCSMASCCMSSATGADGISARTAKLLYILIIGVFGFIATLFRYYGDQMNINLGAWQVHCSNSTDHHDLTPTGSGYYVYCKGDAAVYRISFVLSLFFGIMTLGSLVSRGFHRGFWGAKMLFLFVMLLICFFIPNSFFDNTGFAWVARVVSIFFLIIQILVLIDFAYVWNDDWVERAFPSDGGDDNKNWLFMVLGSAFVLYLVALVGIPLLFSYYGDCTVGVVFSSLTLTGIVFFTGITLFRYQIVGQEGAILPASVVAAYCTYLCWSALESNPHNECKPFHTSEEHPAGIIIGMIVASASLMWTVLSASSGVEDLISGAHDSSDSDANRPFNESSGGPLYQAVASNADGDIDEDDDDWSEDRLWVFHLTLFTASMYMSMLLTNWGSATHAEGNEDGKVGTASMWVKILSQWFTMLIYVWSLVAPAVLSEYREFDF